MTVLMDELTKPNTSVKTRCKLACARAIMRNVSHNGATPAMRRASHRAAAAAVKWELDGAPSLAPKSYGGWVNDVAEICKLMHLGLL